MEWAFAHFFIFRYRMRDINQPYRQKIAEIIEPMIEREQMELVDVECNQMKSRWLVRIYIDKEAGVTIDDCAEISALAGDILDVHDIPPGPYSLEVSSPGLERPLARDKDFMKYKGSKVKIRTHQVVDGKRIFSGILAEFYEEEKTLIIDVEGELHSIPKNIIAQANLEYEF